jgi:hypothetical protein
MFTRVLAISTTILFVLSGRLDEVKIRPTYVR